LTDESWDANFGKKRNGKAKGETQTSSHDMSTENVKSNGTFSFQNNLGILLPLQQKLAWDGVNFNPYFFTG
jgi:hypothetical protein